MAQRIRQVIAPDVLLPAAGQGALGIEIRADGDGIRQALQPLIDPTTFREVRAERALSRALGGSCQVPLAAYCVTEPDGKTLKLRALVAMTDGSRVLRAECLGEDPEALGLQAANALSDQGAQQILQSLGVA
jgi:hydroxymethylbilane synthase